MGLARLAHRYLVRQTMPAMAAAYYDRMVESVRDFYLAPFRDRVKRRFDRAIHIVDAGCATGNLPVMLALADERYRVTGVDLSEGCLRRARARADELGLSDRLTYVRANLERCTLETDCADLTVSTCSLHHWRHPARILRELARITGPEGEVLLLDHSPEATRADRRAWVERVHAAAGTGWVFRAIYTFENRYLSYTRDELAALCARAGLEIASFEIESMFLIARLVHGDGATH